MHRFILTLLCSLAILCGYPFTALAHEREVAVSPQRPAKPGAESWAAGAR